eukprot:Skav201110  [mRNA]  locus=scaffold185:87424:88203:+ [translate_table: standard]
MVRYSPGDLVVGNRYDAVVFPVCFDDGSGYTLVSDVVNKQLMRVHGSLCDDTYCFSLLGMVCAKVGVLPEFHLDDESVVLTHRACKWGDLYNVIDCCSGMGALGQGFMALGFRIKVAIDSNSKMLKMHSDFHQVPTIHGSVTDRQTLLQLWQVHPGPAIVVAGFSCQPYSFAGDRLQGDDSRAQSLEGVLKLAFFTRAPAVVLECVTPAKDSDHVRQELNAFVQATGYVLSECVLELHDVMPCRRSRWWAVLTSGGWQN